MKQLLQYKKNGYEFVIVLREGDIAMAVGTKEGVHDDNIEVFEVKSHNGRTVAGHYCEPSEYPPSNEEWGLKGWTYSDAQEALDKFTSLVMTEKTKSPQ